MKKSLLALAAMGAFAGAAQAQSSVTVYGILDMGFTGKSNTVPSTGVTTTTTSFSGAGSESSSRLGFRGTEDLGGGTRAFFTAEFQLYPTQESLSGNSVNGLNNRQSFVGIGQKGIGQVAIGTQYTPIHIAMGRTTAAQQNNVVGDVIYAPTSTQGSDTNSAAYTVRQYTSLTAQSDRFAGFTVSGMYVNNNSSTSQTTSSNQQGYALGLNYVWTKLNLDAVYQVFKSEQQSLGVNSTTLLPVAMTASAASATNNPNGVNLQQTEMYFGGAYDFGILKAYAAYISRNAVSTYNNNLSVKRTAQQIGVRGNITKTVEGWAAIGNGRTNSVGVSTTPTQGSPYANFSGWQVGSNYWLSKRTNLYAIYGMTATSSTTTNFAASASQYAVGARHTF